jgi:hypothetical protein
VANDQAFLLDLTLDHPIHTLPAMKLWRQVGGTSASVARIARVLGVTTRYPPPFNRVEIFESLFHVIDRSPQAGRADRTWLKRELLVSAGRRYLRKLRSPGFAVAKLAQDFRGR